MILVLVLIDIFDLVCLSRTRTFNCAINWAGSGHNNCIEEVVITPGRGWRFVLTWNMQRGHFCVINFFAVTFGFI